jgi:hypothetical protein
MIMNSLNKHSVLLRITVFGEDEEDAIATVYDAIDSSNLVDNDGLVSVEVLEDSVDTLTDDFDEDDE